MGRFMRAPDHDSGTGDDSGADSATDDTVANDATGEAQAAEAGDADGGDDETLMGAAGKKADEGAGDEAGGDGEEGDDKDEAAALPEAYEIKLENGEKVDEALLAEADPVFRDLGLSQEQVDKLTPLVGKVQANFAERFLAKQTDNHNALAASWAKEAKAAPDIGGDKWATTETSMGRALDMAAANLPTITRTVDGKPVEVSGEEQVTEFRQLLNDSKLGNHPALIRMFAFYGSRIGEDNDFIRADGGAQVKQPREAVRYPQHANNEGNS